VLRQERRQRAAAVPAEEAVPLAAWAQPGSQPQPEAVQRRQPDDFLPEAFPLRRPAAGQLPGQREAWQRLPGLAAEAQQQWGQPDAAAERCGAARACWGLPEGQGERPPKVLR